MSDVEVLAYYPALGAVDVDPATPVSVTLHAASGLLPATLTVTIDGVVAYAAGAFARPAYAGRVVVPSAAYLAVQVRPRRAFFYSVKPDIQVAVGSTGFATPVAFALDLTTRAAHVALADATLRRTAVDVPVPTYAAVEVFRQGVLSAIRGRPTTSALVALYHRVATSSLRGLLCFAPFATPAARELANLAGADVASLDVVAASCARLAPLWETVLKELLALGLPSELLAPVYEAGRAPYPSERVAAAAAVVLLGTQKLIDAGLVTSHP